MTSVGVKSLTSSVFALILSVIITTVLYLSDALRQNFLNENFDYKVSVDYVTIHTQEITSWVFFFS